MAKEPAPTTMVMVPPGYPCATFFVDESSAKESGGTFFVVGAIKTRRPGRLLREVRSILDKEDHAGELKFSRITRARIPLYTQVIAALEASDAHLAACVVDSQLPGNPFSGADPEWIVHARVTAKLLVGNLNRRELGAALLDGRSTPKGQAFDDTVRAMVNHRLRSTALVSAICAESDSNLGLQLADLVAGAVANQRRATRLRSNPNSHRSRMAAMLASVFGVESFSEDVRTDRVNVITHGVLGHGVGATSNQRP